MMQIHVSNVVLVQEHALQVLFHRSNFIRKLVFKTMISIDEFFYFM